MKNIALLFILALIMTASTFAQVNYNAIIFSENGEKFWVMLNGVRQNDAAETNAKIVGLNANGYRFKIVFQDASIPDIDKNMGMPETPTEVTFRIKQNKKGSYVLRYFSQAPLPSAPVAAPSQQMVTYSTTEVYPANPREEITTTTTTSTTTSSGNVPAGGSSENVNMNMNIGGISMGVNVNVNENYGNTETSTTSSSTTTTTSSTSMSTAAPATTTSTDHYVMSGYDGPMGCPWPMEKGDYASAKSTIASKSFDDTKLTVAKQIVSSNCLFADQVKEITELMSFEDSKLDFAKYAYSRTYDQGNYFKVNNAFDFESTIEELNVYISTQR